MPQRMFLTFNNTVPWNPGYTLNPPKKKRLTENRRKPLVSNKCRRQELNLYSVKELDPKSSASANSATAACRCLVLDR